MEAQNTLKVENGAQRLESPLDVLSRAASMIQKEASNVTEGNKGKEGKERESSSDSGFEDSPSSPTKQHPAKIIVTKERREKRIQERRNTTGTPNPHLTDPRRDVTDPRREISREEEERYRLSESKAAKPCGKDCAECKALSQPPSPKSLAYHEHGYMPLYPEMIKREAGDLEDDKHYRPEDERDHKFHRYPRIPPPPLISLRPPPLWLPPHFPSPLSLVRRQSVITSACCPQQYVGADGVSICPCANPKCNIQAISFGSHVKSPTAMKREVFSAVPPGFELPTVEEHFRKSLGSDYEEAPPVESLNSVDEHFAKALGNTWYNLKYKKSMDAPFTMKTRERVLSSCNL